MNLETLEISSNLMLFNNFLSGASEAAAVADEVPVLLVGEFSMVKDKELAIRISGSHQSTAAAVVVGVIGPSPMNGTWVPFGEQQEGQNSADGTSRSFCPDGLRDKALAVNPKTFMELNVLRVGVELWSFVGVAVCRCSCW
ncbi:hypothetical protein WICPIJ_006867 [Wickerhamomyces pijperi]|uniref:Uncharacterized protein n=1 Tax=Wickerhamomyces pijperi TaxID=599730 RepID=A0A9P8Q2Y8_WICPI|nr:hypothetical protein WICPIJ_006867 [Wickerhamomyces pijperi]